MSALAAQHRRHRLEQYNEISPGRPRIDIRVIEPHPLVEREVRSTRDLPQTRDSRLHRKSAPSECIVSSNFTRQRRPGPDDRHVAPQHVEEIGKFVDARTPQHLPERVQSRIVSDFKNGPVDFAKRMEFIVNEMRPIDHRSKFEEPKRAAVPANPLLREKRGSRGDARDSECGERDQRGRGHEHADCDGNIHRPFYRGP